MTNIDLNLIEKYATFFNFRSKIYGKNTRIILSFYHNKKITIY